MQDVKAAHRFGCDAVIFMIFNNFTAEEVRARSKESCSKKNRTLLINYYPHSQATDGHEFSGYSKGGLCEAEYGRGYATVVDQGMGD